MTSQLPPHPTLDRYYSDSAQRPEAVNRLFDAGAPYYERVCNVMSFGTGEQYRGEALVRAGLKPGMRILDVATGTGLVLRSAARITGPGGLAIGLDPSSGMLKQCRESSPAPLIRGRGEGLPFADGTFDMISMGYGLRHVADLNDLFAEYRRVLKPQGRVLILELTQPSSRFSRTLNRWFLGSIVPALAYVSTGSADARRMMDYFWDTIESCVPPATILGAMAAAGFRGATRTVKGGVLSEYVAAAN
jgi:demethylmenaquinone methyltransferase/2-methoxy-6-polyprenyl-1,4-benzoquinol methylase